MKTKNRKSLGQRVINRSINCYREVESTTQSHQHIPLYTGCTRYLVFVAWAIRYCISTICSRRVFRRPGRVPCQTFSLGKSPWFGPGSACRQTVISELLPDPCLAGVYTSMAGYRSHLTRCSDRDRRCDLSSSIWTV